MFLSLTAKDAQPAIKEIKPNIYCKGLEYKKNDHVEIYKLKNKF